jgi:hypothetical protein
VRHGLVRSLKPLAAFCHGGAWVAFWQTSTIADNPDKLSVHVPIRYVLYADVTFSWISMIVQYSTMIVDARQSTAKNFYAHRSC